jgi:DNA-binding transcriptional MerR regulator
MVEKNSEALKTIGEVTDILSVEAHTLRFWEEKFSKIKPQKRRGIRYYSSKDIELLLYIKDLLYIKGYTIKAVQNIINDKDNVIKLDIYSELEKHLATLKNILKRINQ